MDWTDLDWPALDRLRDGFLSGSAAGGAYWKSNNDLAAYDLTYGERIGWKWDHVLRELRLRGWRPTARTVFDWGCGSGVAGRRVIEFFGADQFDSLTLWDHSPLACEFAADAAQKNWPALSVAAATPGFLVSDEPLGLLVISHVWNELSPEQRANLRALIPRAAAVLWVEPGTHEISRQLGGLREDILGSGDFSIVAPCTHQLGCPMFAPGNERHWCHFFAPPPPEIFADSNWVKFGQRAGIDLRSLPYAFFAMDRAQPRADPAPLARIIGRPEHFKPYARWLNCDRDGLLELELPKRADPALFKQLERTRQPLVYSWERDGSKVRGGRSLAESQS